MIRIEKDKIIVTGYDFEKKEIPNNELALYLNRPIEFGEDVTLERLLNIVIENKDIFNIIFSGHMGGYMIDYYVEEFNKDADSDNDWVNNISHCEVYAVFDHMVYKKGEEENSIYYGFHGKGSDTHETNYGFMGSSINNYKHLPIKVNKLIEFTIDTGGKLHGKKKVSFEEKYKTIHKGEFEISVFEFIGAILHEISYMGLPEDRKKQFDELEDISKRIDSGEEKLFEMKWDDDGNVYFLKDGEDGERDYLLGKDEDDEDGQDE
jgi:hypothetical protein